MKYKNIDLSVKELLQLIENDKIDLQPPYQRNFTWTAKDQRLLIDSILKGYPLPTFFIHKPLKGEYEYEMVDGQQRAKTISRFAKGLVKSSDKKTIHDIDKEAFLSYTLNFVEISELDTRSQESVEEFYFLVNKRGLHLNPAEVNKAYYHDSSFLKLVEEIMDFPELQELEIFSDNAVARMNDRSLIEELVAYLFKGITDKRKAVEDLFISNQEVTEKYNIIRNRFEEIIHKINGLNEIKEIKSTRYRQRNDFYTLFCFINESIESSWGLLEYQYGILLFFDSHNFITPSNEDCEPLREYALNCVSQSNSKNARQKRLDFLNAILLNKNSDGNQAINDIQDYLISVFDLEDIGLIKIEGYFLLDLPQL